MGQLRIIRLKGITRQQQKKAFRFTDKLFISLVLFPSASEPSIYEFWSFKTGLLQNYLKQPRSAKLLEMIIIRFFFINDALYIFL